MSLNSEPTPTFELSPMHDDGYCELTASRLTGARCAGCSSYAVHDHGDSSRETALNLHSRATEASPSMQQSRVKSGL